MTDYSSFPEGLLDEWRRVLSFPREQRLDALFAGVAFPLQRRRELTAMVELIAEKRPFSYMEIGADKGGTLFHVLMGCPTVKVAVAVEPRGCPYRELFEAAFPRVLFTWHECRSEEVGPQRVEALFIDGDKCRFKQDFERFPAQLALFHDVCDSPMREAFHACGGSEVIRDVTEAFEPIPDTPHGGWLKHWRDTSCTVGVIRR